MIGALEPAAPKVALVTGGAGAIGGAIVRRLLAGGFFVATTDIDPEIEARAAEYSEQSWGIRFDLTDVDGLPDLVSRIEARFGPLCALVNCAGIASAVPLLDMDRATWERTLEINLTMPFLWTQIVGRGMAARRAGRIVNIASVSGLRAGIGRAAYGTSKAGLIHLTKQCALELGPFGVTCNAIAPGPVQSALATGVHPPSTVAQYNAAIPQGRYGQPAEIAEVAAFLCGTGASHVNGEVIAVDGGYSASGIGVRDAQAAAAGAEEDEPREPKVRQEEEPI